MLVNPASGALVRDPSTYRAIEAGTDVDPLDPYWSRLIIDGDVVPMPAVPSRAARTVPSQDEASS